MTFIPTHDDSSIGTEEDCNYPEFNRKIVVLRQRGFLVAECPTREIVYRMERLCDNNVPKILKEIRKECAPAKA